MIKFCDQIIISIVCKSSIFRKSIIFWTANYCRTSLYYIFMPKKVLLANL